jgi:hypothetical protein
MGTIPAAPAAIPGPHPCPVPNDVQKKVDELEGLSKKQDLSDAKLQLTEIKQINGEVDKAEAAYKQEYETMRFALAQCQQYVQNRTTQIDLVVSAADKKIIDAIVSCVSDQVDWLEKQWKDAQPVVAKAQTDLAAAKLNRQDKEKPYRDALDYKSNQKDVDALQAQSTKLIDAKNFRGAYFLVEKDMADDLTVSLPEPKDYNTNLEKLALAYFVALDAERTAQTAFDQANADLQKKLKAYSDADAARRDNIVKQIADQQFTQPAPAAPPPVGGAPAGPGAPATGAGGAEAATGTHTAQGG